MAFLRIDKLNHNKYPVSTVAPIADNYNAQLMVKVKSGEIKP